MPEIQGKIKAAGPLNEGGQAGDSSFVGRQDFVRLLLTTNDNGYHPENICYQDNKNKGEAAAAPMELTGLSTAESARNS